MMSSEGPLLWETSFVRNPCSLAETENEFNANISFKF